MCNLCSQERASWEGDVTVRFQFDDEQLEYYDGVQAGWLRCVGCEQRFAFQTEEILPALLWHWALVPETSENKGMSPQDALAVARRVREGTWLSLVEDRRTSAAQCSAVTLTLEKIIPPILRGAVAMP